MNIGAGRTPAVTSRPELAYQLEHPSPAAIWSRAVEIFGSEKAARQWMNTPLAILGRRTPRHHSDSANPALQREVLAVLLRIDYGLFS